MTLPILCVTALAAYIIGVSAGFKGGSRSREIELRVLMHQGTDINEYLRELP